MVHHNLQLLCGSLYNRPKPIYCFFSGKKTETYFLAIDYLESAVGIMTWFWIYFFFFLTGNRSFINVLSQLYHNWTKAQNENTNTFMSSWGSKLDTSPTASNSLWLWRSPPSMSAFQISCIWILTQNSARFTFVALIFLFIGYAQLLEKRIPSSSENHREDIKTAQSGRTAKGYLWYYSLET